MISAARSFSVRGRCREVRAFLGRAYNGCQRYTKADPCTALTIAAGRATETRRGGTSKLIEYSRYRTVRAPRNARLPQLRYGRRQICQGVGEENPRACVARQTVPNNLVASSPLALQANIPTGPSIVCAISSAFHFSHVPCAFLVLKIYQLPPGRNWALLMSNNLAAVK
jgi:hypothetical protein